MFMEMFEIVIVGICAVFVAIIHFLEAVHLMEWLKKWPKIHSALMSRWVIFALLVVGVSLLGLAMSEHRQERISPAAAKPKNDCSANTTGPATATGTGNTAISGNCNGAGTPPKGATDTKK
jgi:hypothetical protein